MPTLYCLSLRDACNICSILYFIFTFIHYVLSDNSWHTVCLVIQEEGILLLLNNVSAMFKHLYIFKFCYICYILFCTWFDG